MRFTRKRKSMRRGKGRSRPSTRRSRHRRRRTSRRPMTRTYRGGYGPGATPLGSPYTASNSNSWPGVSGSGSGNWIAHSRNGIPSGQPIPEPTNQRGGSSIFTDITNVGREIGSSLSHFGSTLRGVIPDISSFPSVTTQAIGRESNALLSTRMPPNIPTIHANAGRFVAGI